MQAANGLTDEDLLLSGDPEDFGRFYDRYVDMLWVTSHAGSTTPRSRPT